MLLKCGVDPELEEKADFLLQESRRGITNHSEMRDYLSEDQWRLRYQREKMTPTGNFDILSEPGIWGRTYAPRPFRPTNRMRYSLQVDPWRQDCYEDCESTTGIYIPNVTRHDLVVGGYHYEPGPHRDPSLPIDPHVGRYGHLSRSQRSRIRSVVRKFPANRIDARAVVKGFFALKYDLPLSVIDRICVERD